jgi:hypothetical protein
MGVAQPSSVEANPDSAVEPAGESGQIIEEGFGEEETLAVGRYGAEPHSPTLVAAMEDRPPMEAGRAVVIPIQDPKELFSERVNYKR